MKKGLLFLLSALLFVCVFAQTELADTNNAATPARSMGSEITLQRGTDFQSALKIIENISLIEERKNIVNTSSYAGGIPFQINSLPWREALNLMISHLGLMMDEKPGAILVSDVPPPTEVAKGDAAAYNIHDKMIKIDATFLSMDKDFARNAGINWNTLFRGQVNANVGFLTGDISNGTGLGLNMPSPNNPPTVTGASYGPNLASAPLRTWKWDKTTISLDAVLALLETRNKGDILARPSISVINGKSGAIHVGTDVSYILRATGGNTSDTEKTYNTGIILNVSPVIIEENGFEVIYLQSSVEVSNVVGASADNTTIARSTASADVMLFNGEETVIGGLQSTQTDKITGGIPLLNRLPWWLGGFFFRWTNNQNIDREMVVILKAEIIPSAMERLKQKTTPRDVIDEMREDFNDSKEQLFMSDKDREKQKEKESKQNEELTQN